MLRPATLLAAAAFLALAAPATLSQTVPTEPPMTDQTGHDMGAMPAADASAAVQASKDVMQKMHTSMMTEPTGNPDVDFARGMIPHHQGAIDMAKIQLEYGKDPELRAMAEEIVRAQEAEIATLNAWLAKNDPAGNQAGRQTGRG